MTEAFSFWRRDLVMASFKILPLKKDRIIAIRVLIFAGFIFAAYFLIFRLISQIYYQKAVHHFREGYYLPAAEDLKKAVSYQTDYPLAWRDLGRAYGKLADLYTLDKSFEMAEKSKQALSKAFLLNPLDPQTAFYLAVAEARLQALYAERFPGRQDNPYDALPKFRQAISLRPNSISYYYTLARYLYREGKEQEFLNTVKKLIGLSPSLFDELKYESFWLPAVYEAAKQGLQQAIESGNEPDKAHFKLADILEQEKDWEGAIDHLEASASADISPGARKFYYNRLGRLYLLNDQPEKAKTVFMEALQISDSPEKDLEGFFGIYKKLGRLEELMGFYETVQDRFIVSEEMDLVFARALLRSGEIDQAFEIFSALDRKTPSAKGRYWLARIAEKKNDMEGAATTMRKAITLDPRDSSYHLYYSNILSRMNSLTEAEKEADLAIKYAEKPSSRLFAHRAYLRRRQKDESGYLADLETAIELDPNDASLYLKAAEGFEKNGKLARAEDYYKRAVSLKPESKDYQQKLAAFKERHGQ